MRIKEERLCAGAVELLAAIVTILAANIIVPVLPYFLGFAAGEMIYVVVEIRLGRGAVGKPLQFLHNVLI